MTSCSRDFVAIEWAYQVEEATSTNTVLPGHFCGVNGNCYRQLKELLTKGPK